MTEVLWNGRARLSVTLSADENKENTCKTTKINHPRTLENKASIQVEIFQRETSKPLQENQDQCHFNLGLSFSSVLAQ
jgi:hypothetical protein